MAATPDSITLPTAGPRRMPDQLVAVLQRAHIAELQAVGEHRRPAFRLTRALLGGAHRAGYSAACLAECLGLSLSSVRSRSGSDGWVSALAITQLADLAAGTVELWQAEGLLPSTVLDQAGQSCYLASDLIRALIGTHPVSEHPESALNSGRPRPL
jgi:hypothetical protein